MVDKLSICSCDNSTCGHALAAAMEFLGAMKHRGFCEKQVLAVALSMVTIADDAVEHAISAIARETFVNNGEFSLSKALNSALSVRHSTEHARNEVVDVMNEHYATDEKAQKVVADYLAKVRETAVVDYFGKDVPESKAETPVTEPDASTDESLLDVVKRAFPGAKVMSIDISRFGKSKPN